MKKIFLTALLSASLGLTLTACKNDGNNENNSGNSSVSSSSNVSANNSQSSSGSSGDSESSSGNSESSPDENSSDSSDDEGVDNSSISYPDTRSGRMVKSALSTESWPMMEIVTDPEMIDTMFSTANGEVFNLNDLEEYCFCTNLISSQLNKVIVVKPVNGREGAVEDVMDSYLEYSKNGAAFYPEQEVSAAGSVSGKTADNYMYLVVHENGQKIADAIKDIQ